jgi:hypothetical protein
MAYQGLPTSGDLQSNLTLSFLQKLAKGISMGKYSLFLLTFIPFTGVLGMNHAAMGNSSFALLKSSSYLLSGAIISFMLPFYPWFLRTPIVWGTAFGLWWLFDILEFIDKATFDEVGFRLPLKMEIPGLKQDPPNKDGNWTLTTPLALSITAALATSGVAVANYIPANILPANIAQYMSLISVSTGVLLGIGAIFLAVTTTGATAGALGPSAVPNPLIMGSSFSPMVGGGDTLPPLSYFAGKLLKSKSADESYAFFSVIALVILGGVATAWSK